MKNIKLKDLKDKDFSNIEILGWIVKQAIENYEECNIEFDKTNTTKFKLDFSEFLELEVERKNDIEEYQEFLN